MGPSRVSASSLAAANDAVRGDVAGPWCLAIALLAASCRPVATGARDGSADRGLIPRQVLFGDPERTRARLSPDGRQLAYLAPDGGALNIHLTDLDGGATRVLTRDRGAGIHVYDWAEDGEHLVYLQDRDGDENWHLFRVAAAGGAAVDLTPIPGVQARIVAREPSRPRELLVGLNDRDSRRHDVYRIDLASGRRALVLEDDLGASAFLADHQLEVRIARVPSPDGGERLLHRRPGGAWQELRALAPDDAMTSEPIGFAADDRTLFVLASAGSNTTQLRAIDVETGAEKVLFAAEDADVAGVLLHPADHALEAVAVTRARTRWTALADPIAADVRFLDRLHDGDWRVVGRDRADRQWLVLYVDDDGPGRYYLYDRTERRDRLLFSQRPELDRLPLAPMRPVSYGARDRLTIHGYLTLPPRRADERLPAVILIHGGPWYRDEWAFNAEVQWLVDRGYAVLQPNFRGSSGYGKAFLNAGDREWGARMQDDITDGTRWLVDQGIADPGRICLMGTSYGGYATLMGLAREPELYACGVAYAGVANLITWHASIPSYWESMRPAFNRRVGDPVKDAAMLRARSPVFLADQIAAPLLIGQGANDPRVPRAEALQIVEVLRKRARPVEYLEFADEGHGMSRPENRLRFYAAAERFLAEHLGGRHEP
jgi:dipeptidyl aminopeptidase/acylaminoacyl peptidase